MDANTDIGLELKRIFGNLAKAYEDAIKMLDAADAKAKQLALDEKLKKKLKSKAKP